MDLSFDLKGKADGLAAKQKGLGAKKNNSKAELPTTGQLQSKTNKSSLKKLTENVRATPDEQIHSSVRLKTDPEQDGTGTV